MVNEQEILLKKAREIKNQKLKEYRAKNKNKVQEYNQKHQKTYWSKKAIEELENKKIDVSLLSEKEILKFARECKNKYQREQRRKYPERYKKYEENYYIKLAKQELKHNN